MAGHKAPRLFLSQRPQFLPPQGTSLAIMMELLAASFTGDAFAFEVSFSATDMRLKVVDVYDLSSWDRRLTKRTQCQHSMDCWPMQLDKALRLDKAWQCRRNDHRNRSWAMHSRWRHLWNMMFIGQQLLYDYSWLCYRPGSVFESCGGKDFMHASHSILRTKHDLCCVLFELPTAQALLQMVEAEAKTAEVFETFMTRVLQGHWQKLAESLVW